MPNMLNHPSTRTVKMLVAADTGNGKTGALASLVDAGYNLRVLDVDNGLSVLAGYVKDKSKLANIDYVELFDTLKLTRERVGIVKAEAFQNAMSALDGDEKLWGKKLGHVSTWTDKDVLVIDSFSMLGRAALALVMQVNGKGFSAPEIQHYGTAMDNLEKLLGMLTSPACPCNVIFNTHLTNVEGTPKLYPEALGSKLGPKVGRYFDNMITISIAPGSTERKFKTQKDGLFACKTAKPIAAEYPIATGLADIFKALLA